MVKVFPAESRILIVGRGTWDVAEATEFRDAVRAALARCARGCGPLDVFADLTEHDLQCSKVSDVNAETAAMLRAATIARYALAVPGALLRLQARRLLSGINFSMFATREEAATWIEWPLDELTREVDASREQDGEGQQVAGMAATSGRSNVTSLFRAA